MNELLNYAKPGVKIDYVIGGETLIIEPRPYGRLSALADLILGSMANIGKMESKEIMVSLPKILNDKLPEIMALLFDERKHGFLSNTSWIEDNLTFYDMKEIFYIFIKVNGLEDFLGKLFPGMKKQAEEQTRELQEKKSG